MSADELRKAAETLRERARAADVAPWKSDASEPGDVVIFNGEGEWTTNVASDRTYATGVVCFDHEKANGDYIATMHPGVGLALADVLDGEALTFEKARALVVRSFGENNADDFMAEPALLTLARLINGGAA